MLGSIRNQILIPILAIQAVAITVITVTTASLAARRVEREIVDRINRVVDSLADASFPYTTSVLTRMRGLSGAHFVALSDGRAVASTLRPGVSLAPVAIVPAQSTIGALGSAPRARIDGEDFFAISLRSTVAPRGLSLLVLYPETSWRQARWDAATVPLLLGIVTLAVMALMTTWIARRMSRRVRQLEQQVASIAQGEFQQIDPGPRSDELHDLSISINHMSSQLSDMRRAVEHAERARLLGQLAAGLAHQLRNALTGARMSIQLYLRRHPNQNGDASLDVAIRQLAITEEQVKGLLSLGRLETAPPEVCDVNAIVSEVVLLVEPACRHGKVEFRHQHANMPTQLLGDRAGLRAAILNLALNAIEAAGAGGQVACEVLRENGHFCIDVSDTGAGPPTEIAGALFEPFVTGRAEGVGLGLAVARQVALEHGGTLAWSREADQTHFRLSLTNLVRAT